MRKIVSILIAAALCLSSTGLAGAQSQTPDFDRMSQREIIQYIDNLGRPFIEGTHEFREFLGNRFGVRDDATFRSKFPRTYALVEERFVATAGRGPGGFDRVRRPVPFTPRGYNFPPSVKLWGFVTFAWAFIWFVDGTLENLIIADLQESHPELPREVILTTANEMTDDIWMEIATEDGFAIHEQAFLNWYERMSEARERLEYRPAHPRPPHQWIYTRVPSGGFNWDCPPGMSDFGGTAPNTRPVDPNLRVPPGEPREYPGDTITVTAPDPCRGN